MDIIENIKLSTSYIEYKKNGFWVNDIILIELSQKLIKDGLPDWFPEFIKKYYHGLSIDDIGSGCITLWLDELLVDNSHAKWYKQKIKKTSLESKNAEEFKANLLKLLRD